MANEVNNEVEESKTGENSTETQAPEQNNQETASSAPETQSAPAGGNAPRTVAKPSAPVDAADETAASGDIDFGAILEQFEQEQTAYHPGDLVEGKVVGVSDRGALIDFGYKSEGVIAAEELAA